MSEMISVASGFQYSVNIGYDLNHDDKLQNFIPTKSSMELLQDILQSTDESSTERARVLVGAYGKGKSHIVLTILSVLMRKKWDLFVKLKEQVGLNPELRRLVDNYYDSGKKILPVIINGSSTSMQQAFLLALQKSLSEYDLMGNMPDTNYQAAIKAIKKWESEFPDTLKRFKKEIGQPIDTFIEKLGSYDAEAYHEFEVLYPKLTSGSMFNPFLGFDIAELYESVVKCIEPLGYSGIFVVYDEFSKFLEANIKEASVSDTKMLQDFAEKCNRSGKNQLHLMLISHKEIANYIDKLPKQKVDGWRGVSERFKHIHLNNNFTQTYEIISSVIKKTKREWSVFERDYKDAFESLFKRYVGHAIFADMTEEDCDRTIRGCYPLHPVTIFMLPRLSERVAQNERTLFTFLSAKGTSTLPTFLEDYHDDCFKMITPDVIFDYFEPLFRKESYASELHKNYMLTKVILEKLDERQLEAKLIKALSLIYILEQFDKIKPTANELDGIYSLEYTHEEVRQAIDNLINKEYVIYLKVSNEYLRLKQSSGVDVKQEIMNTIERHSQRLSVKQTLNAATLDNYMYPSKYNDEREMTRYFSFEFIDGSEVTKDVDWEVKSESTEADGVIYGIIPENEESIPKIKELLLSTSKGQERFIFILPKKYTEIHEIACQFNAVMELKGAAEGDDLLFDEYEVIYEDLRDVISEFIGSYTRPENFKSIYIYEGIEQTIMRKAALTGLMSQICENVYSRTPIINNEAINKNELSGAAYTSRNKIIAGLLRNTLESNLGFTGTGQEVSIMRSTLVRKNILVEEEGVTRINLKTGEENIDHMLGVISGFIHDAKRTGVCEFSQLYYDLMSYHGGIGIRKSLIPIYLAAVLHEYKQEAVIISKTGQIPLNLDALLQIEADPSLFQLQYLDWDPEKEGFIKELDDIFGDYIIEVEKTTNAYEYVVSAMRRWYMALPKYSKERIPQGRARRYKGLIRLLKQNIGSYELLFVKLPDEFGQPQFSAIIADTVKLAKEYYDRVLDELIEKLIESVRELFLEGADRKQQKRSSLSSIIKDWCESLDNSVFEQLFENGADRCIGFLREVTNDEKSFITRLAKLVTGLRIEDWEEKTVTEFEERLREYKETAEEFSGDAAAEIGEDTCAYSLTYIDDTGKTVTKRFDRVEQSNRGKLLLNSLLADIESMGHAISEQEKRQTLMEVLKKLC